MIIKATPELVKKFLENQISNHFRYFNSRDISIINNHVLTLITLENNNPIAYGHIDFEKYYWLGICVLEKYHHKGYGTELMKKMIEYADTNSLELRLSVDINNLDAIRLYKRFGFKQYDMTDNIIYMIRTNIIELPVSFGEALDKLSILEIKLEKISDNRRKDVQIEYDVIKNKLDFLFTNDAKFHYDILKTINRSIWDMQDIFRDCPDEKQRSILCMDIIKDNDRRFRVKHKLNSVFNSYLREQKGYVKKKAFFLGHLGLGDNITCIPIVRYLATLYDQVKVVCKNCYYDNLILFYKDDPTIEFYPVNSDIDVSVNFGCPLTKFAEIVNGYDVYTCGYHKKSSSIDTIPIPFCFFNDVNIPDNIFWKYYHVSDLPESKTLYDKLKNVPYIFIHNMSSNGIVFESPNEEKLIINPNYNTYDKNHKYYDLAQDFLNKPLSFYKDTIINASKIILCDSSFFCFSIHLDIITTECYYIGRGGANYDHIFNTTLKRKFIRVF